MTKHGTKSSQKAEMTPQELADKYEYGYRDFKEVFLSDLRSVLRGELIRYDKWQGEKYCDNYRPENAEVIVDEFLNNNQ